MSRANKIIIISGTSGSGKTTLVNYLMACPEFNLEFSISACSRKKRKSEIDGKHYIFLSLEDFKNKINLNEFLEWEEVYDKHLYGTLKRSTMDILNSGKNILFDVDVKGAESIKNYFQDQSIGIFIQAPSIETTRQRLLKRGTESLEEVSFRVEKIQDELLLGGKMDYQLINNNLSQSKDDLYNLINQFLDL